MNGGFEAGHGWMFGDTKLRAHYSTATAHSGQRSVLLGNRDYHRPNIRSYSSVSQRVHVPGGFASATLSFWNWNLSDLDPGDYQEMVILDGRTGKTLAILWRTNHASTQWEYQQFDISRFLGRDIVVYFNVFNDGDGGRAAMWIDDVSLKVCGPAAVQPLPPSSPTQVVPPTPATNPTPLPAPSTLPPQSSVPILTPTVIVLTPTRVSQPVAIWPTMMPTPTPASPYLPAGLKASANILWYLLILAVIVLIFIIGYLLVRQILQDVQEEEGVPVPTAPPADGSTDMASTTPPPPAAPAAAEDVAWSDAEAVGDGSQPVPASDVEEGADADALAEGDASEDGPQDDEMAVDGSSEDALAGADSDEDDHPEDETNVAELADEEMEEDEESLEASEVGDEDEERA